jgi:DNA repair exonuclease SbcCD nuclease subunit
MGSVHPFEAIEIFGDGHVKIVYKTLSEYEPLLDKDLVYVPYVSVGRFMEALDYGGVNIDNVYTIFAHQEFRGSDYRGITSKEGDSWSDDAPFVISGHIHKYQRIGKNIVYVGAPIQFSQDEEVGKTVSLFTFAKDTPPKEERISLGCKEYKSLQMNVKEFMEWKYDSCYYWHLTIKDVEGQIKVMMTSNNYKSLRKLGVEIRVQISSIVTVQDVKNILSDKTVDYYMSVYNRIKEDELMLKYLQKCKNESG